MYKIILIYYVLVIAYVIVYYFRKRKNWLSQLLILTLCPGIGIVILFEMNREYKNKTTKMPDWLIKKPDNAEKDMVLIKPDIEKELSVVPMNDTLILNDNRLKRRALLNLLKTETIENVDILTNALTNGDSETAHYAATAIMEIKRKMLNSIHALERLAEAKSADIQTLTAYAEALKRYISSNLLDEQSKKIYLYKYSFLLEKLIEIIPQEKSNYIDKINCDIELKEFETADIYCQKFIRYCGNEEEAYFTSMKYYYLMKDKANFDRVISQLKSTSINLSPEGLKVLRFWLNGVRV
jgi:hypothetical protein